ncbi:hypothetical protein HPB50_007847 [Hyalomma asiaticum]|uniref:Uncharacterized protein n=1 Tax=Hyalomma asiaticum TaxID=266040 RepID=A0ACB7T8V1_HYAAI|nr:hypothetical protein HPB50_007847 [Hyalomma asiaticum]
MPTTRNCPFCYPAFRKDTLRPPAYRTYLGISVLSKGMNFAVAPQVIPKRDIIVETEECFRHMKDTAAVGLARSRIVNILANSRTPRSNLSSTKRSALEDLRSDPPAVVLEADKGKGIVVMNRKDYEK